MDKKTAAAIFLIAIALSLNVVAVTSTSNGAPLFFGAIPEVDSPQRLAFTVPIAVGAGLNGNCTPLNQPTRMEIYTFIKGNPGVHFRGLCSNLNMPIGTVQYHASVLERAGFLKVYFDGQNKRFFESKTYSASDMKLISVLRHETTGKILTLLSQNDSVIHKDLAQALGVTSQALTWQMHQLKKAGIIEATKDGLTVKYSLTETNQNKVTQLISLTGNLTGL